MASPFEPRSSDDILKLIAEYPLAWVVSQSGEAFAATPLPMLAECDDAGRLVSLLGHFALRNPQVEMLRGQSRAQILFMGPQGYISPSMAGDPAWGPTWNYAVVRFTVDIAFDPQENDAALARLVAKSESDVGLNWTVDQLGPRYADMVKHIIAFRATIVDAKATFKLGQDERPDIFGRIVESLRGSRLAEWMRAQF